MLRAQRTVLGLVPSEGTGRDPEGSLLQRVWSLGRRRFDLDLLGSLDARTKESVGSVGQHTGEGWDCPQYLPAASAPRRPHPQRL
ncbi:hypothetical protein [Streptomyces sp. NL15-2K]|uniref:hypothetical protein n=1 Tax=Streptomyces sp. NL15-2K TaxID=376149 RepID=UPI000F564DBB|nr:MULTISPECIES: hypothetical protein [Actinomycetes]WKX12594.1 hypothetical protein Q4V64_35755 [Kutzneria buriramensis]GCB43205.1 hypothetical protein SNL152K_490 [Streptomyces sp. NL15-2K]